MPRIWRFQVFEDRTNKAGPIEGMLPTDGPCTYLPGNEWILCDTHPCSSRAGKFACIDSPHAGGHQLHLIVLRPITG